MGLYADYQSKTAPTWLRKGTGTTVETDFGAEKDVQLDRMVQGVRSNMPGICPPDALDYVGQERKLPRAVSESPSDSGGTKDQTYAERLRTAWTALGGPKFAGSHGAVLRALDRAGFPMGDPAGVHIVQRVRRYSYLSGSGGSVVYGTHALWTFDDSPSTMWNQFGLVIGADFTPPIGSTFADGDPSADLLNALVRLWKPTKARFMGTWVIVSGPTWGWPPSANWGDLGRNWGGGVTRFVAP